SVTNGLKSLPAGIMRELVATSDIACGIDMPHVGSQAVVHGDSKRRILDTSLLQVQSADVRLAADCDQKQVSAQFVMFGRNYGAISNFLRRLCRFQDEAHTFTF